MTRKPATKPHRGATLNARQIRAAELIFQGKTLREVGAEIGVNASTVLDWSHKPAWAALMAELERGAVKATVRRLRGLTSLAADRVETILRKTTAEDGDALRASFGVLDRVGIGPHETHHVDAPPEAEADTSGLSVEELRTWRELRAKMRRSS